MSSDDERMDDLEDRVSELEAVSDRHSAADLEDRVRGLEAIVGADVRTYPGKPLVERAGRLEEAVGEDLAVRVAGLEKAVNGSSDGPSLAQRVSALETIAGHDNLWLIKWKAKNGIPAPWLSESRG